MSKENESYAYELRSEGSREDLLHKALDCIVYANECRQSGSKFWWENELDRAMAEKAVWLLIQAAELR